MNTQMNFEFVTFKMIQQCGTDKITINKSEHSYVLLKLKKSY